MGNLLVKTINILFVCLGNICRSPMAEYLMREKIKQAGLSDKIKTASAGTSGWHDGENMHCGTLDMLELHKIDTAGFQSRKVQPSDWQNFDYIIAMDNSNLTDLEELFGQHPEKLFQITSLCPDLAFDHIPDPWYTKNFQQTYELLDQCCNALLKKIQKNG
ncbi:low molecular weight phosphotyrosine protein phosphatase [[Haemophilus] felis]|uniref:protein-tyrosine-phosphatase n=1 Tax=[Haemophilus] felis TaxID=123822 RepID=A0A1T0AXW9_9PAST|nr:low molecular weight phosphotyrosine protein phosphatase [[Haemophilus] felis]NBI41056.1 low molecular weight phosphotyrosine protein phosphatase [[Haemophilus] felis]OOS02738.1 protein-tyrosine-phosphatase [[Haemophilus] felis]